MTRFADLPLFASDAELAAALFGRRAAAKHSLIDMLARRPGFPPIDEVMGGRYIPAVKAFFDHRYKLRDTSPAKPQGVEGTWENRTARKRQGSNGDPEKVVTLPTGSRPPKRPQPVSPLVPSD